MSEVVTVDMVRRLSAEAWQHGDRDLGRACDRWLDGDESDHDTIMIERAINEARAMDDEH